MSVSTDRPSTAWERWIRGECLVPGEVASHVLASWERCLHHGLDPLGSPRPVLLSAAELARRQRQNQALLTVAHRFMSDLCSALPGCRFRVAIADREGYKLGSLGASDLVDSVLPGFERSGVGEDWSEAVHGTNGVGTALVMGTPVFLRGEEHFFAGMRTWNCSGVPLRDPVGTIVGVLNVSGPAEEVSPVTHGLAIAAAREIERELELAAATRRLEEQNRRLTLFNDLEGLLAEVDGEDVAGPRVVEYLCRLAQDRVVVLLGHEVGTRELFTEASHPADPVLIPSRWPLWGDSPAARCFQSRQAVLWSGADVPETYALAGGRPGAVLAVPILAGSAPTGVLLIGEPAPGLLEAGDVRLYEAVARRLGAYARLRLLHRDLQAESGMRRAILEQMDAGIVVLDLAHGRLDWNRPMARYFAAHRRPVRDARRPPRPDHAMKYPIRFTGRDLGELLDRVISLGETSTDEAIIFCDPPHTYRVTTGPVYGPDGRVEYVLQTYADITSYRRLEQQKAELVAMISHELRTPLTGIKGYAQLMGQSCGDGQYRGLMEGLLRETDTLAALVERVVAVNRIDLDQTLSFQPVSLRAVLQKVKDRLSGEAELRGVELSLGGPDLTVRGDPEALRLIFSNLVENAVKYSPAGGRVTIRLGREGGAVRVEVSDSGPGISAEHHEAIFQRFYRVPSPETATVPGSGLGLYIVRRLVERQGGRVKVASRVGRGTTFTVTLPEEVEGCGEADHPRGG